MRGAVVLMTPSAGDRAARTFNANEMSSSRLRTNLEGLMGY